MSRWFANPKPCLPVPLQCKLWASGSLHWEINCTRTWAFLSYVCMCLPAFQTQVRKAYYHRSSYLLSHNKQADPHLPVSAACCRVQTWEDSETACGKCATRSLSILLLAWINDEKTSTFSSFLFMKTSETIPIFHLFLLSIVSHHHSL